MPVSVTVYYAERAYDVVIYVGEGDKSVLSKVSHCARRDWIWLRTVVRISPTS